MQSDEQALPVVTGAARKDYRCLSQIDFEIAIAFGQRTAHAAGRRGSLLGVIFDRSAR
jgi:hypothetical protein